MDEDKLTELYRELNERARSYTGRLWYVPFAYIGIVGITLNYLLKCPGLFPILATMILSLFSLSVFVHIVSIRYHQQCAVAEMQKIENTYVQREISEAGSSLLLSPTLYTKIVVGAITHALLTYACLNVPFASRTVSIVVSLASNIIVLCFEIAIVAVDYKRSKRFLSRRRRLQ